MIIKFKINTYVIYTILVILFLIGRQGCERPKRGQRFKRRQGKILLISHIPYKIVYY